MALLRTISGRVRSFQAIKNAVTHHGQRVAQKLHERFNRLLPDHLKIDFWLLMQALFEPLEHSCDRLISAEHELVGERGNDKTKQLKRDEDGAELGSAMLGFRTTFVGIYAPPDVEGFGFPTVLGQTAFDRLRQGEFLLTTLEKQKHNLPVPRFTDGINVDKDIAKVGTLVEALRVSNAEAEGELKAAQAAVVDKDRAADNWDGLFPWCGRIITALFRLAGEHELARFIAPSTRRVGRTRVIAQEEILAERGGAGEVPANETPGEGVHEDGVHGDAPEDRASEGPIPEDTSN